MRIHCLACGEKFTASKNVSEYDKTVCELCNASLVIGESRAEAAAYDKGMVLTCKKHGRTFHIEKKKHLYSCVLCNEDKEEQLTQRQ